VTHQSPHPGTAQAGLQGPAETRQGKQRKCRGGWGKTRWRRGRGLGALRC